MPETTPLIKAALNLRVGAGFDVYNFSPLTVILYNKYEDEIHKWCRLGEPVRVRNTGYDGYHGTENS